jgi:cytochrome d ubiquinol oxidase subunit II
MTELWFFLLCLTLTMFIVMDGWNFGAGVLQLTVATNEAERRQVFAAIGPLWSWNEVWLVAAGGTFALAFPRLMGLAFSGFYLAVFLVLWSLLLRGISIEVRGHIDNDLWRQFWDHAFAAASLLLAVLPGIAIGNLVRGLPLDGTGEFSLALFTDFTARGRVGLLDWYTVLTGAFSATMLCAHGATYLALRTEEGVHDRSVGLSRKLWIAAAVLLAMVSWATWFVRPDFFTTLISRPVGWVAILGTVAGVTALVAGFRARRETWPFAASCCILVAVIAGAAESLFPVVLRSTLSPEYGISVQQGASADGDLWIGIVWWPVAFVLAMVYFFFIARAYRGKARLTEDTQGFY